MRDERWGFRRGFRLPRRGPRALADEIEEEILTHLAMRTERLVAQGLSEGAAREEALRRFGDMDDARQRLRATAREREAHMRRREWLESLRHDLTYAARQLRRAPGFTVAVALTLALGIGANAVMFGVVDRLLLSPPPHVRDADQVSRVQLSRTWRGMGEFTSPITGYANYRDLAVVRSFAGVAAFGFPMEMSLGRGREALPVRVASASAGFFPLLGVKPRLGRFFLAGEDGEPQGMPVAVVSEEFWRRHFGADPGALGTQLPLGDASFTVVGVAPRNFTGVDLRAVDIWVPVTTASYIWMQPGYATDRGSSWLQVVARLRLGADPALAATEATLAHRRGNAAESNKDPNARVSLSSVIAARGPGEHTEARVAAWLLGVAAIVLLIACANVATMLLTRALRRRQEIAVRLALGVSRARLVRQLLVESLLLATLGAVAALVAATWGGALVRATLLPDVGWSGSPVDARVLAVTAIAALATGLIVGAVPALQTRGIDLASAIKSGARGEARQPWRLRSVLLTAQVALSVALLVGAGLFVRSLRKAEGLRLGFDARRVTLAEVSLHQAGYDPERQDAFWRNALERVRRLPGVESAALTIATPVRFSLAGTFIVPGLDSLPQLTTGGPYKNGVSPSYFATLGARMAHGRPFTEADTRTAARVVIVNETMARLLWPGREPLGTCVRLARADSIPCATVVGVVEDVRRQQLREEPTMQFYVPLAQWRGPHSTSLLVRARGDAGGLAVPVRRELQALAPDVPFPRVTSLAELLDPQLRPWRLGATMFTLFGALAFLVAVVGLAGLLAYTVAQRGYEIGVRVALGARSPDVVRLVLARGAVATAAGLAVGLAAALLAGRLVRGLLFDVTPADPIVFAAVAGVVVFVAAVAALPAARRAARVSPMIALRAE
ncbi:MAG: ADOP family duplicated permease [Gemmatimonadaceae bacterium]